MKIIEELDTSKQYTLDFIVSDLWPKLGLLPLPLGHEDGISAAEYLLFELVFKHSKEINKLNLCWLQELFTGKEDKNHKKMKLKLNNE